MPRTKPNKARPQPPAPPPIEPVIPPKKLRGPALWCGIAVVLAALALYVNTAARDIVVGDTPELMTVAVTLGVAHPSGYPLLTMLGHLFSLLPIAPVAFSVNLSSAFCGAAAVGLIYLTAWHLSGSWGWAAIAALAVALDPLFWSWSLVFEAFSLNNFLAAAMIYLLVLWEEQPARDSFLIAAAFVGGLGLANHLTIVLLGPAALLLMWRRFRPWARPDLIAKCVVALCLGLLPYAYIPWAAARHSIFSWGDVSSLSDLVALMTRKDYGSANLSATGEFQGGSPFFRLLALARSFPLIALPLVAAGAVYAYRFARNYFWFVLCSFLLAGPFFVAYANLDLEKDPSNLWVFQRFFLLPLVITAPLIALGLAMFAKLLISAAGGQRPQLVGAGLGLIVLAALAIPAVASYSKTSQRENHIAGRYAQDLLDSLEPGTLLLAAGDEHGPTIAYVHAVEGRRPDLTLVWTPLLKASWYPRLLRFRYPDLHIPTDKPAPFLTLRDIVDANQGRPIASVGGAIDKSLENKYGYIQHGLVSQIEPIAKVFNLGEIAATNDALLGRYQPPSPESIHRQTFEPQLLRSYAAPAEWLGTQYRQVKHNEEAAVWYRRALKIDPDFAEAKRELGLVTSE